MSVETAAQQTDVMMLEAVLLEVADEPGREIASIRFYGSIRENGGQAEEFDEIWNLVKPRSGNGGWLLAGIQQAGHGNVAGLLVSGEGLSGPASSQYRPGYSLRPRMRKYSISCTLQPDCSTSPA